MHQKYGRNSNVLLSNQEEKQVKPKKKKSALNNYDSNCENGQVCQQEKRAQLLANRLRPAQRWECALLNATTAKISPSLLHQTGMETLNCPKRHLILITGVPWPSPAATGKPQTFTELASCTRLTCSSPRHCPRLLLPTLVVRPSC